MSAADEADRSAPEWINEVDELVDRLRLDLGFIPFDPTPARLYTGADLYRGLDDGFEGCVDQQIYRLAQIAGGPAIPPVDALAQRLHDHGITIALDQFRAGHRLVGLMGGHAMARGSVAFGHVVAVARALTNAGHCVTTGGGPGAMEAANFGAATADLPQSEVDELVAQLATVPSFAADPDAFIKIAVSVAEQIDKPRVSLSVPTWFYGHEPSNPFATHIAKYFSNSEREAGLLAIATAGIVFVPGGPGTMQEVFQDGAQNAYETFGSASPMVFMDAPDEPGWWERSGILTALDRAFVDYSGNSRPGRELVQLATSIDEVLAAVR
jgi:predicted Rossmann-fold nucleotide-binding protein